MEGTTSKNSDISVASVEEQIAAIPAAGRDLSLVSAAHAIILLLGCTSRWLSALARYGAPSWAG